MEATVWLWPALAIGAAIGSFLNVVIYRLPRGLSLIAPGSHCPACKTPLSWRDNIPVLGWLFLRGRCCYCSVAISPRYPLVEATLATWFGLCVVVWGLSWQTLAALALGTWLLPLALIDLDTYLLPEALTRSGLVVALVWRLVVAWLFDPSLFWGGIWGAVAGIWITESIGFVGTVLLRRPAIGGGDGKLLAMIGMWLGLPGVVLTLFLGSVIGLLGSVMLMARQRLGRSQPIPFGPYLALGAAISTFVGTAWLDWLYGSP